MAWAAKGTGNKVALLIPGGPGNAHPGRGLLSKQAFKPFLDLLDADYRLVTVTRRMNMPAGHTIACMARDYAELILTEFGGRVELIVGTSFGGLIAQFLAANHGDCFQHLVIHIAACDIAASGKAIDCAYAKTMSKGKRFKAGTIIATGLFPYTRPRKLIQLLFGIIQLLSGAEHASFRSDILVECEAESLFDSRDVLPQITKPVLLLAGDSDFYFPLELLRETQALIPHAALKLYPGMGHVSAGMNPAVSKDILEFINATPLPSENHSD
ncbi:MAG: alpha/beta hydrolase [Pseudomonadota bacterium]